MSYDVFRGIVVNGRTGSQSCALDSSPQFHTPYKDSEKENGHVPLGSWLKWHLHASCIPCSQFWKRPWTWTLASIQTRAPSLAPLYPLRHFCSHLSCHTQFSLGAASLLRHHSRSPFFLHCESISCLFFMNAIHSSTWCCLSVRSAGASEAPYSPWPPCSLLWTGHHFRDVSSVTPRRLLP